MTTHIRWRQLFLLAAGLGLVGALALGSSLLVLGPAAGSQGATYPRCVLILRHAEKPKGGNDPHLTSRGAARAAALPSLFVIPPAFPTKPAPFPTPDFLFATKESKNSNRPVETVTPLAKALGDMHIQAKHTKDDFPAVLDAIFGEAKYARKTVLICWRHGRIPKLTRAVVARAKNADKLTAQVPTKWDNDVYDRVWQVSFDESGQAAFADLPQRLLFDDRPK
jgi:hypothetical protein